MKSSQPGSGGGLPRLGVALGIGLAAVGAAVIRRAIRGPTRSIPPVPQKRPHEVRFGKQDGAMIGDPDQAMDPPVVLKDDYFWLRDDTRTDKEVLDHLRQENAYTNGKTMKLRNTAKRLYKELLSHVQETDEGVPVPHSPFVYYSRTEKGQSYAYHCRKQILEDGSFGKEEIYLDENQISKHKNYCDVEDVVISPDHTLVAYSVDFSGNEKYDIVVQDIASGKLLEGDRIVDTNGYIEWGSDNSMLYYSTMDEAHRSNKVWRHQMRYRNPQVSDADDDVCLYTENDETYSLYFAKSSSERFIFVISIASITTEIRFIDLHEKRQTVHLVAERQEDVRYSVSHVGGDRFLIVTNADGARNSKIMQCRIGDDRSSWKDFVPYDPERTISDLKCFETFTVVQGRQSGFSAIWVMPDHNPDDMYQLKFDEEASVVGLGSNREFRTDVVRVLYSSLTTPMQTWDYNVRTKDRVLKKETPVPNFDKKLYKTERLEIPSADGTRIPVSLIWNERAVQSASGPNLMHLYGYGSYNVPIDPQFSSSILPLLDRGVVYAIAHVRGGGEKGRVWYEAARFETKARTFEDFVACAEYLVSEGRTSPQMLSIEGRSAGGLLLGAVVNMRPDLFRAVIAGVPFVDVLNTMSDAKIPLTTGEWLEWGNPHQQKYFKAIRAYCPYQNIARKPYPSMLVIAGLHDPRVLYSEPCKWVAKLREHSTSGNDILLKIDLDSGHFSATDRYRYLRERAFELSWLLSELRAPLDKVAV